MRTPTFTDDRRGGFDATMTPMIDVVFLLLVFFVWTASLQTVEHILPSSLTAVAGDASAAGEPPPPPDFDPLVIQIVWLGDRPGWIVGGNAAGRLADVTATLTAVAEIKTDVPVIIDPAAEVPLGDVIDLYDASRVAGFEKIQFAASEGI